MQSISLHVGAHVATRDAGRAGSVRGCGGAAVVELRVHIIIGRTCHKQHARAGRVIYSELK